MMGTDRLACAVIVLALLIGAVAGSEAAEIPPMPPVKTFYTEVPIAHGGAPNCVIAVPSGADYAQVGQKIAAAIKQVAGASVPVMDASTVSPDMLQSSNMILVGYFANNPLVNRLCDEHYVALDVDRPGAGGYVVRTVHDPLGKGTCFVYLGGADSESVAKAADDFIASLPEKGDISYPHTVKIVMPDGSPPYKPNPDGIAARVDEAKGKNFGAVGGIVTNAAANYYLTGNPEELEIFKQTIPVLREQVSKLNRIDTAGGAGYLFNMWDNVEEAPQFSDDDRARITQLLWEFAHKWVNANEEPKELQAPIGNYSDGRLLWDIARYFKKYYDLDVARMWTVCDVHFKSKARFWRSAEDCPGYGGSTMIDTLYYVLSAGYDEFWESGTGGKMGDYGIAVMNNLGGHAGFGDTSALGSIGYWANIFEMCAWKYRDGRYVYAYNRTSGLDRNLMCHNTYRQNEIAPVLPQDMLGIHVVPLPDWVYEYRTSVLGTAPKEMNAVLDADPTPPREECFDKITFRTSLEPEDQYLILGGSSHGYHSHPDGNSIIEFTDNRRYCIFDSGYFVPDTVEHNTLVVYRDGLFEPIPRLTGLSALGDFENVGMTQTYLNSYNGVNWRRNIIWNKEKYFVVVDEVEAEEAGNYGMSAIFRTLSEGRPEVGQDRVSALYKGRPFNIICGSYASFKTAATTPPSGGRYAVLASKSARMQPGDRQYFLNLLYCADAEGAWPYDMVPAGDGAAMIQSHDGYAFAGTGECRLLPDTIVDARVFYCEPQSFSLVAGRTLTAKNTWFASDVPVNISISIGKTATGTIEAKQNAVVRVYAKTAEIQLDGKSVKGRMERGAVEFDMPAGKHALSFTPAAATIETSSWRDAYTKLRKQHEQKLAALTGDGGGGKPLQAAWKVESATSAGNTVYLNKAGKEVTNLTRAGKAMAWTEGTLKSTRMGDCVDGRPDTYSAGYGDHARTLPKDFGMEWDNPVMVANFQIDYVSEGYGPTMEGQQLQAWDGKDWYPITAQITRDESKAKWDYAFKPVETTRMRVFITDFAGNVRTAVCEMRFFPEPAIAEQREVRVPFRTNGLAAGDVDGDGRDEVVAAIDKWVKCIKGDGTLLWQKELETQALSIDAYDLDHDGKCEVVVGGDDCKLYCFDSQGNERWSAMTPADAPYPEREPSHGRVEVVGCADIDGDGDGETIAGCSHKSGGINWHAYCYDHAGALVWKALNWAHPPTSICFADMGDGKLATFIGTQYNSANAFGPDGKGLLSVSVGYHGAAMSVAAGDMDGNGKAEMIAGSRIGGVHCGELGSRKSWAKFMGAEVSQVALADLNGDGKLELVAGSKNFHLLVTDAEGSILWSRSVGEAIRDLVAADVDGNGTPEIIVGTEGGMVRIIDAAGNITGTLATGDSVTHVIVADLNGDRQPDIVAACDDGFVYGNVR